MHLSRNDLLRLHRKQSGSLRVFSIALHTETKKQDWCRGWGGLVWQNAIENKKKRKLNVSCVLLQCTNTVQQVIGVWDLRYAAKGSCTWVEILLKCEDLLYKCKDIDTREGDTAETVQCLFWVFYCWCFVEYCTKVCFSSKQHSERFSSLSSIEFSSSCFHTHFWFLNLWTAWWKPWIFKKTNKPETFFICCLA